MSRSYNFLLWILAVLVLLVGNVQSSFAQAGDGGELIDAANPLRVAKGLPILQNEVPTASATITGESVSEAQNGMIDEEGYLIHIVQPGESLASIAVDYDVDYTDLLALNGFIQDAVLYPNDKIRIRLLDTATPTPEPTSTLTPVPPTPTRRPTRTTTPIPTSTTAVVQPDSNDVQNKLDDRSESNPAQGIAFAGGELFENVILIAITLMVVLGSILVVVGGFLRKRA